MQILSRRTLINYCVAVRPICYGPDRGLPAGEDLSHRKRLAVEQLCSLCNTLPWWHFPAKQKYKADCTAAALVEAGLVDVASAMPLAPWRLRKAQEPLGDRLKVTAVSTNQSMLGRVKPWTLKFPLWFRTACYLLFWDLFTFSTCITSSAIHSIFS